MKVETFIVNTLKKYNVTDTFGIPGGVVLKLLYEMQNSVPELTPHLCYHEQSAGFAACGYAQSKGTLGVAYATRGPGIMNMLTCIAEAYQESLPVLFITAHGNRTVSNARFDQNQELDVVSAVKGFTKYAANINTVEELAEKLEIACKSAISKRKGPVLLDFSASLWGKELDYNYNSNDTSEQQTDTKISESVEIISNLIKQAKHPILLIGDGMRHSIEKDELFDIIDRLKIPVLSSRGSQDLLCGSPYYFGYIGSHGIRYSNFILSKADFILTLGNRLAFPVNSESFSPIMSNSTIVRVDIDEYELNKPIPGASAFCLDAGQVLENLVNSVEPPENSSWLTICNDLKKALINYDCTKPVECLTRFIKQQKEEITFVCDVGNNEFWFSRAFEYANKRGTVLCSKSFGSLGAALGKAIGAYYANRKPIVCVLGDQGFQYNLQELQFIAKHKLPIQIVVLNNNCSGMILDHESKALNGGKIHVTRETGYYAPDIKAISSAYGLRYIDFTKIAEIKLEYPTLYEISIPPVTLTPNLPKGNPCQDMEPLLDRSLYKVLSEK